MHCTPASQCSTVLRQHVTVCSCSDSIAGRRQPAIAGSPEHSCVSMSHLPLCWLLHCTHRRMQLHFAFEAASLHQQAEDSLSLLWEQSVAVCMSPPYLSLFSLSQKLPCGQCREQEVRSGARVKGSAPTMRAYVEDSTRLVPAVSTVPAAAQTAAEAPSMW